MAAKPEPLSAALDDMRDARERLLVLIDALPAGAFDRAPAGGWSARRVLQHVIESEHTYAKLLAHMCGRTAPDAAGDDPPDPATARAMLAATGASVLAMVEGIDDGTLYRLVRLGHEEYSPLSVLQNIASHDRDHEAQIAAIAAAEPRTPRSNLQHPTSNLQVRPATSADLPRLTEIYNHYVINTPTTFDLDPWTPEKRAEWFTHYGTTGRYRLLVAEEDGRVIGYTSTSRFRPRQAYETTVEMSIICAPEAVGRRIGEALYSAIFEAIRGEDIHMAIAGVTLPNDASVALHERFGFTRVGIEHEVGRKFGKYWDVMWLEKRL